MAAGSDVLVDDAERGARLTALNELIEIIRPAVQADGGI